MSARTHRFSYVLKEEEDGVIDTIKNSSIVRSKQ